MKFSIEYNDDFYSKRTFYPFYSNLLQIKKVFTNFNDYYQEIKYYEVFSLNDKFEEELENWLDKWISISEEFAEENKGECDNALCISIYENDFHRKASKDFLCTDVYGENVEKICRDAINFLKDELNKE